MNTKIKHRSRTLAVMFFSSMALVFISCMIPFRGIDMVFGVISVTALGVTLLLMLLSALLRTSVTVENGIMSIGYVFITQSIPISDITALSFTHKQQMIKGHTEYRVNLDIGVKTDNTLKTVSLNDDATIFHNHLTSDDEQIPDENVPLYNVYIYLTELTGLTGNIS